MSLTGKQVFQIEIKSSGDVFHELFKNKPHEMSSISPDIVHGCELHHGDWGTVGSIIFWTYTHDGQKKVAKEIIESIDKEKKSVTFKVIKGDLLKLYKSFTFIVQVENHGQNNLVTWTLQYEKLNQSVPDPTTIVDLATKLTKDIETHHLNGKLVNQIEIKSDGDVFHEIFRHRPHHVSTMSPTHIQGCELHDGNWGTVGSVIFWNYTHDGKKKVAKEVIQAIDEAKRSITFKVIEGDLLELYKTFIITVHVDTHGKSNLVTWTLEYEKKNPNIPDPNTLMDFCLHVTKDIETHHLK
ncbi:kirola [Coffea arabica]|uniref:Kirola n=1 Tax=Coffea arabica TaxID=13443 RepID=A0A6P6VBJ4_COFAR